LRKLIAFFGMFMFFVASFAFANPTVDNVPQAFEHGDLVMIDGQGYYYKGMSIPDPYEPYKQDVPGHYWLQTGPRRVIGLHYNTGMGMPFWAMYDPYGILLYKVDGIIDVPPEQLSPERETWLKDHGYVHIHEFVSADTGEELEDFVVYLKHTAVTSFYFTPPMAPWNAHDVNPGIDYEFIPNW